MNADEPAFPVEGGYFGLSKREYFAAMAMQGICAGLPKDQNYIVSGCVGSAVEMADALTKKLDETTVHIVPKVEIR